MIRISGKLDNEMKIPGAALASTIKVLAGLGSLGERVLKEHGVTKIDNDIQLIIEDDGKGFSAEIMQRLGDPYVTSRQKDDSLKDGLGLGFFISKTLFERLGIKMEIYNKNKPESGAVVSILIPEQGWT